MPEIQAHVFRFNGKYHKDPGVGPVRSVEQYQCQLFQVLLSGIGVVRRTAFGAS